MPYQRHVRAARPVNRRTHIHHLHTEACALCRREIEGVFQLDSFFVGGNIRKASDGGYADYIPIFLSETRRSYRCGAVPQRGDIQASTPDKHGFVSLGTSVDAGRRGDRRLCGTRRGEQARSRASDKP